MSIYYKRATIDDLYRWKVKWNCPDKMVRI